MVEWHKAEVSDISLEFGTDINSGRTNINSKRKRKSNNDVFLIPSVDSSNIVRKIASDASLILLTTTYVIAALLGLYFEALIAIPVIIIAFSISCYIRYRSEKRMNDSHAMLIPKARVIENGVRLGLSALDVEVGDLIYFGKGDIIPADARLISSDNLLIAERFYAKQNENTEYYQVSKNHESIYTDNNPSGTYENMVYAGSVVVSGKGRAIVTAIGSDTRAAKRKQLIHLAIDKDRPACLNSFYAFAKRFSLAVLLSVIPVSLFSIFAATQNNNDGEVTGILYTFLIFLAISVISMGELISAPASAIVSQTLFAGKRKIENGITRLSATEKISDTDTLLILCPEVLVDKRHLVRRVFYSDKEYRFDSLKSTELDRFTLSLEQSLSNRTKIIQVRDIKSLRRFVSIRNQKLQKNSNINSITLVTSDTIDAAANCEYFRTEGGSTWRFSAETRKALFDCYNRYTELGLSVYLFTSFDNQEKISIFEAMVAIGEEYPFTDGAVFSDCINNGITPVLVLEKESDAAIKFALNCGIAKSTAEIVLSSELSENYKSLADTSINSKVYIGFGRSGTKDLLKRYADAGKHVLPVLKDLSDKNAILPANVYGTHSEISSECIKYNSSLSLRPADSEKMSGGVKDVLTNIINSRQALLKLNLFKRYLTFATIFRIAGIVLAFLSNAGGKNMSALMILLSGLLSDGTAFLTISKSKEVKYCLDKNSERILIALFAVIGFLSALASHITVSILLNGGFILSTNTQMVQFFLSLFTQLIAIGVFLLPSDSTIGKVRFNIYYFLIVTAYCIYILVQNWLPDEIFSALAALAASRIELKILPALFIPGILAVVFIFMIVKFSRKIIK